MSFASVSFLLFFLVVLLLLLLVQRVLPFAEIKRRIICQGILLIASYVFYGWWNMRLCLLLMGITWISFFTAVKKDEKHLRQSRISLLIGVGTPLAVLGIFKYYDFFVTSFCDVFHLTPGVLNLILPVGISFYTFQALSYTIDVYTGKIEKEKSFLQFALYLSFFPQLVAGPIVKASEFLPQLKENRKVTLAGLESGIQIFVFGMFKKVVLADNISVFVDEVYRSPQIFGSGTVALAVAAYAIQIYMDFSGYSDMAIGCAKCMGYELPVNFNLPYISHNVSEFWKRWHISLSSWLMQYLYIPLGGNRKGRIRTYVNLMITMLLGGLWHGAEWSFVLWGGLHGLALCIHKGFRKLAGYQKGQERKKNVLVDTLSILGTDIFVCICWIFFRAENVPKAWLVLKQLFGFRAGITHPYSFAIATIIILCIATVAAYLRAAKKKEKTVNGFYPVMDLNHFWSLVIFFVEIGLILGLAYVKGSPFIYFQF